MTERLHCSRPIRFAFCAMALFAAPLHAQDAAVTTPVVASATVEVAPIAATPSGPTMDAATVAVKNVAAESKTPSPAAGKYYDQGTKLMIIGGAAILTGILVGGDAGHAISIAGAVIGLYGLYKYLE